MRLSHQEAQALVSARLDGPLDPIAERELNAHLASCDSCRAFNASVHRLATGLQQLPYLPPSPAVTRAVLEHISAPASPWAWLGRAWSARALPTVAAVATAMIIVFAGTFAALRVLDDRDNPAQIPASTESTSELAALPAGEATDTAVAQQETETATEQAEETSVSATEEPGTGDPATEQGQTATGEATDAPPETTAEPTTDESALSGLAATEEPTEPTAAPTEQPAASEEPVVTEEPAVATEVPATEAATEDDPIGPPETETGDTSFFIGDGGTPSSDDTATEEPVATESPTEEPTAEPTVVPTEEPTEVPTQAPSPTPVPTEIPTEEPSPTPVPTDEPTEAPIPTPVPTEEPTPTDVPTEEPSPTPIPTEEPTPTPVPTEEPEPTVVPIEQVDGSDDGGERTQPTEESDGTGGQSTLPAEDTASDDGGDEEQTIGPSGPDSDNSGQGSAGDDENDDTSGPGSDDGQTIEQDGETTPIDTSDDDGEDPGVGGGPSDDTGDTQDLAAAPVYTDAGSVTNAGDRFGISAEGDLIFSTNPGRASLEFNGLSAEGFDAGNGQIVRVCSSAACIDASADTATGSQTDTPLGWLDGELIYERMNGKDFAIEYRAIRFVPGSIDVADDRLIGGGGGELESIVRPYPVNGTLLVPARGAWVRVSTSSMDVLDSNPYGGGMSLYRVHPEANAIAYVAEGSVMVASLDSPGSPYASVPLTGADFDISPDGQMIAMYSGDGIEIYNLDGSLRGRFSNNEGMGLAGIAWIPEGLLFYDASSGQIRILPT